jgi:hypothetical protein
MIAYVCGEKQWHVAVSSTPSSHVHHAVRSEGATQESVSILSSCAVSGGHVVGRVPRVDVCLQQLGTVRWSDVHLTRVVSELAVVAKSVLVAEQ